MIAIDVGSGLTKCVFNGDKWYIPSVVGVAQTNNNIFVDKVSACEKVTYEGKQYFTGDTAMSNTSVKDRFTTVSGRWHEQKGSLVLHLSSIARSYPDGKKGVIHLVTGLPVKNYLQPDTKRKFENILIGTHKFSTEDAEYEIEITQESLIIIPQALGLHLNMMSLIKDNTIYEDKVLGYVDCGTRTTDFCNVVFNKLSSTNSGSVSNGMSHLANDLAPIIKENYNFEVSDPTQFLRFLKDNSAEGFDRTGKVVKIDLLDESRALIPETFKDVFKWIESNWKPSSMYLFLSGGGAKYLLPVLKEKYKHLKLIHPNTSSGENVTALSQKKATEKAVFDVVSGYYIYAKAIGFGQISD